MFMKNSMQIIKIKRIILVFLFSFIMIRGSERLLKSAPISLDMSIELQQNLNEAIIIGKWIVGIVGLMLIVKLVNDIWVAQKDEKWNQKIKELEDVRLKFELEMKTKQDQEIEQFKNEMNQKHNEEIKELEKERCQFEVIMKKEYSELFSKNNEIMQSIEQTKDKALQEVQNIEREMMQMNLNSFQDKIEEKIKNMWGEFLDTINNNKKLYNKKITILENQTQEYQRRMYIIAEEQLKIHNERNQREKVEFEAKQDVDKKVKLWCEKNKEAINKVVEKIKLSYSTKQSLQQNNQGATIIERGMVSKEGISSYQDCLDYFNNLDELNQRNVLVYLFHNKGELELIEWHNNNEETAKQSKTKYIPDYNELLDSYEIQKEVNRFIEWAKFEMQQLKLHPENHLLYQQNKEYIKIIFEKIKEMTVALQSEIGIDDEMNKWYEYISTDDNIDEMFLFDRIKVKLRMNNLPDSIYYYLSTENKADLKSLQTAITLEKKWRSKNPGRQYKMYFTNNNDKIIKLKENISNLKERINKNNDSSYEKYENLLKNESRELILKQFCHELDLDCSKIVYAVESELKDLFHVYDDEKVLRDSSPERCFVGRENQKNIKKYFEHMDEFLNKLESINLINEKTNKDYIHLIQREKEKSNWREISDYSEFFVRTSNLCPVVYTVPNLSLIYSILNFDNKLKIQSYCEKIVNEIQLRAQDQKRNHQWYINDKKLSDKIKLINERIAKINTLSLQDNALAEENDEKLYLKGLTVLKKESESMIRSLFESELSEKLEDSLLYYNLVHHINIDMLKEAIIKEQSKRELSPERSFYYASFRDNINTIMKLIENLKGLGQKEDKELTVDINNFYEKVIVDKKYKNAECIDNISQIDFLYDICKFLNIIQENSQYNLYYFLSKKQKEEIQMLQQNCAREYALREMYASRSLNQEYIDILQLFRSWLKDYIVECLGGNSYEGKQEIVDLLGISAIALEGGSLYKLDLRSLNF